MNRSRQPARTQGATELVAIVGKANDCAARLRGILDEEREALSVGDVARIDRCTRAKTDCLATLEDLESKRGDLCRSLGLTDADLHGLLAGHGAAVGWPEFLATLAQCRDANAVNGTITQLRRRHVERALTILRGADADGAELYGPTGRTGGTDAAILGVC